jgi:DnaJ domain
MEASRHSYYRILHVQPDAPVEVIRSSYRTIMQRLRAHPDLGGDHETARLLNEAYGVLSDPRKRAAYDREAAAEPRRPPPDPQPAAAPEPTATGLYRSLGTCLFCKGPLPPLQRLLPETVCETCGVPLFPASRLPSGPDARALPRLARHHRATLFTRWPQGHGLPAETRDLSPLGVGLLLAESLPKGSIARLESDICRAVVRIASARPEASDGRHLLGAEFLTVLFPRPRGAFVSTRA